MGKTTYTKCIEFMQMIKKKGYEVEIPRDTLIYLIKAYFGDKLITVERYLNFLLKYNFIELITDQLYKVNEKWEKLF